MIEDELINAAIIGSCNLCRHSNTSLQFEGLGRLTNTTETRSFSANGMFITKFYYSYIHALYRQIYYNIMLKK